MDADLYLRAFMPRACAENDEEVKAIPDAENKVDLPDRDGGGVDSVDSGHCLVCFTELIR